MLNTLTVRTFQRFSKVLIMLLACLSVVLGQPAKAGDGSGSLPQTSYYHWANSYTDDPALIQTYAPAQLYIKLLDIGYRNRQLVIHPTDMLTRPSVPVIPAVFLDNNAVKNVSPDTIREQILTHIPPTTYDRIQLDCDWTEQTRETYFALLERLKEHYPQLSVTLRLHQVKYAGRTGIPPADRAVLMYYNMSDIRDTDTKNYILDNEVGKRYLQNFAKYPLPIDLALPLYQQIRVIRQGKLVQLINSAAINPDKTEPLQANHYKVTQGHYWNEYYLYPDDELRVDTVDSVALHQAAQQLATVMQPHEIIFYKLNDAARFSPGELESITAYFSARSQPK